MTRLHVNGVDLEYVDEGTGVPVLFSHGGGSDLRYGQPQRNVFAARYRRIAYSHRFHGTASPPATGEYSADAHTTDLVAIMRRLEAGPVHLVGFSTAITLRATLAEPATGEDPAAPACEQALAVGAPRNTPGRLVQSS